jgi:hypothetical protein
MLHKTLTEPPFKSTGANIVARLVGRAQPQALFGARLSAKRQPYQLAQINRSHYFTPRKSQIVNPQTPINFEL